MASIIPVISLCGLGLILWSLGRKLLTGPSFDNIPGPKSTSFWTGIHSLPESIPVTDDLDSRVIGNLSQFLSRHSWGFHQELGSKYGGVAVIQGYLGVSERHVYRGMEELTVDDVAEDALRI